MNIKALDDIKAVQQYLTRIGAEPRSLKAAVIREQHGKYWKDIAVISFNKEGDVTPSMEEYAPTEAEASAIKHEMGNVEWPQVKPLQSIVKPPDMIKNADPQDIFEFRNEAGQIIFVQVRKEREGEKNYIPFTYWDDDEWRMTEPDGPLPLYNADKLKDAATVFIHEGAKAAEYVQWMVDAKTADAKKALREHPWGQELDAAVHLGWIGGALSPYRTDWSIIQKQGIKRAYIVADNDEPGRAAVPAISQQLRIPTFTIQFTDEFTSGFDLADPFPDHLWGKVDDIRHYTGPAWRDCLHPATWATDLISNAKGKPTPVLRDSFKSMWAYVEEADIFVCTEMPEILRSESILNKMLAPFSHAAETSRLIVKAYRGRSTRICYRPDEKGLMVTFRGSSAINLHVPTNIKPEPGDASIWEEFLDYMFVKKHECEQVKKWCATLIAQPETRMSYGMLLISETQGVGKTTLGANILASLVGMSNVGFPGENDIGSAFNDWVAHKRLVIVGEVYSGHSWKAYHALKPVITDRDVTVNQKYMRPYTIENWCHVVASSNSMRALKMENDDRRWFYPEVTEVPWPAEKFVKLRKWLESGGLNIIKHWAENYGTYVKPADRAPMTDRKREMIAGSRSEAQKEAAELAQVMLAFGKNDDGDGDLKPAAVTIKDVAQWARKRVQGRMFDSDYDLKKVMKEAGLFEYTGQIKIDGRMQYALMNLALYDRIKRTTDPVRQKAEVREFRIKPELFIQTPI